MVSANTASRVNQIVNINNGTWFASELQDQPIYARMQNGTQKLLMLGQLKVGTQLYEPSSSSWVTITSLKVLTGSFVVYDLRTDKPTYSCYAANFLRPCPK